MKIKIIGTGNMAHGIGVRIASSKHELTILGKDLDKAEELASKLGDGVRGELLTDKIDGDVVIMALPYGVIAEVMDAHKEALKGKIIIDISNPVDFKTFEIIPGRTTSGAEEIAKHLPEGAKLVKAFNTTFAGALSLGEVDGKKLDVFIASDDKDAGDMIVGLASDSGMRGIFVGPLFKAQTLEGMGLMHISLQASLGANWMSAIKILP